MRSLGINLAIAVMWLLLSATPSVAAFAIGFVAGFVLLALFRPVLDSGDYVRRSLAFLTFLVRFAGEFLVANAKVACVVLFRRRASLRPDFVRYDIADLSRGEILLLSYCVSLTPGTTTVEISDDFKRLTFHALDADRPDELRAQIDRTLKQTILAFTR
jgi:multicomponent Na+:H+ antiporter subunit E